MSCSLELAEPALLQQLPGKKMFEQRFVKMKNQTGLLVVFQIFDGHNRLVVTELRCVGGNKGESNLFDQKRFNEAKLQGKMKTIN